MNERSSRNAGKVRHLSPIVKRHGKKAAAVFVAAATAFTVPMIPSSASGADSYKLVASDDFNGNKLDYSKWGVYEGKGNAGNGYRSADAVSVSDGELKITAKGDTSGGLAMGQSFTYGRYEVRAKVDKGQGYGSAILLWPSAENWPQGGEIDISEVPKGDRKFSGSYVHYGSDNKVLGHEETGDHSQWHTYATDWEPDKLTFYVDGKVVWTVTEPAAIPHANHFLGLQFDVGSGNGFIPGRDSTTPSSVTMHVDSVKIYQK